MFVTSQGSPYGRFRRAVQNRVASNAWSAATELPKLSLADAAGLCLLLAEAGDPRYRAAAVRLHARLAIEARLDPGESQLALAACLALEGRAADIAAEALAELAQLHGLDRLERTVAEWLAGRAST